MLFLPAALLLLTPMANTTAVGVAAVPAAPSVQLVAVAPAPQLVPQPIIGPGPEASLAAVPDAALPQLHGARLLEQLALRSDRQLARITARQPQLIAGLLASPPSPAAVSSTWSLLLPEQQERLVRLAPHLVGGLDGLPYALRDQCNRAWLAGQERSIRRAIADPSTGRAAAAQLGVQLALAEKISAAAASQSGVPTGILSVDLSGHGRVAIAVGDPATATDVSYLVPGMFFAPDQRATDWVQIAARIHAEQRSWLDRLGRAGEQTAVIAWIDYDSPNIATVASLDEAEAGSVTLARSIAGLAVTRAGPAPYLSILSHSYGGTVAMLALTERGASVDALAMVGPAGGPVSSASAPGMPVGKVWVGIAEWDPVAVSGVFGSQTGSDAFGAARLGVGGGVDPVTGQRLSGNIAHNDYLTSSEEALRNLTLVSIDRGDLVMP